MTMDTFWDDAPPAVTWWWWGAGVLGTRDLLHFLNVKEKRSGETPGAALANHLPKAVQICRELYFSSSRELMCF